MPYWSFRPARYPGAVRPGAPGPCSGVRGRGGRRTPEGDA
ncbi:conserved hypothetical protein [Streptomyces sp. SPB78]|nr:conserved hypothetical protein [Streptomyces sp. SPB78]